MDKSYSPEADHDEMYSAPNIVSVFADWSLLFKSLDIHTLNGRTYRPILTLAHLFILYLLTV